MRIAPDRQRLTPDVFNRQVPHTFRINSRIVETCNMRMLEACQDVALSGKARLEIRAKPRQPRPLQRQLAIEGAVRTPRQPNLGHASGAQEANQLVRAHARAGLQAACGNGTLEVCGAEL